jgi:septal ring factor EnvC (AmiA/AmiB activator)
MEGSPKEPPRPQPPPGGAGSRPAGRAGASGRPGQPPPPGAPAGPGEPSPVAADAAVDPQERIDGLRSWLAQLDRKLTIRTYALGAAAVLALAAGIVGIVLARGAEEDAATEADVQDVREQLASVEEAASQAAEEDVESISQRISDLEDRITGFTQDQNSVDQKISVLQDDIQDLRDQISDIESPTAPESPP